MKALLIAGLALGLAATAPGRAQEQDDDEPQAAPAAVPGGRTLTLGMAGLMDRANRTDLEPITLTAGALQSPGEYRLSSGGYYRIDISSDGTQEQAIEGPGLFRNVWVNEVVINDLEVRPLGLWFWGKVWTLIAWCELRGDFRAFRIDRIAAIYFTHAMRGAPPPSLLTTLVQEDAKRDNPPVPAAATGVQQATDAATAQRQRQQAGAPASKPF